MGYYTGNGVVTGGGSTVSLRSFGPSVGGAYYTYNRTNSTVVAKNGVSLATAQAARGIRQSRAGAYRAVVQRHEFVRELFAD